MNYINHTYDLFNILLDEAKPAYIEIVSGPSIKGELRLSEHIWAFSIGPIGNAHVVHIGTFFMKMILMKVDQNFIQEALFQGNGFHELTVIVDTSYSIDEIKNIKSRENNRSEKIRSLLGLYAGGYMKLLVSIKKLEGVSSAEFLSPPEKNGVMPRGEDDIISLNLLNRCLNSHNDDEQLHYWISLLVQTQQLTDDKLKISRLFSLLELMSNRITQSFIDYSNYKKQKLSITRTAIRTLLGYYIDINTPKFIIQDYGEFEFDHIEVAGKLRDKIFHGSGNFRESDLDVNNRAGYKVYKSKPDMISHVLRRDCELAIFNWINKQGFGWQAEQGVCTIFPKKLTQSDLVLLPRLHVVSKLEATSSIGSVFVQNNSDVRITINFNESGGPSWN